jgi:MFS family permease
VGGGFLAQAKGWRWVFWLLVIVSGTFTILALIFMRETYPPVLLQRRVNKLKKETGNENLKSKLDSGYSGSELLRRSIIRPTKMLLTNPIVFFVALYVAVAYGILYLLFTTYTFVFEENYHFSSGEVGLTYIPSGIGMFIGMAILGVASDKMIATRKAKGIDFKPEHRIPNVLTLPGSICLPIGLFIYGWTAEKHVHWIVPLIGTLFVGAGLLGCMVCFCVSLSHCFPRK